MRSRCNSELNCLVGGWDDWCAVLECVKRWMGKWVDGWMDGWMDKWVGGWIGVWVHGSMDG